MDTCKRLTPELVRSLVLYTAELPVRPFIGGDLGGLHYQDQKTFKDIPPKS